MAARKKTKLPDPSTRVRHLIATDATNVMTRLRKRGEEMVSLFSRNRDRTPMLETVRSWFFTVSFTELSLLEPAEQRAVNEFYEELDSLRWYMHYTEDMPGQVGLKLTQLVRSLEENHRRLTAAIGHPDAEGAPVVDAQVIGRKAAR